MKFFKCNRWLACIISYIIRSSESRLHRQRNHRWFCSDPPLDRYSRRPLVLYKSIVCIIYIIYSSSFLLHRGRFGGLKFRRSNSFRACNQQVMRHGSHGAF